MIIQTGSRTDIPGFYAEWFHNRIKAGFVMARNPFNPKLITRYSLSPDVVDAFAFCTKNPAPMFRYMDDLKPYGQYWYVSITPYGKEIEPNVPDKKQLVKDFQQLSLLVGKERAGCRYDPIFINEKYTVEYHIRAFERLAEKLDGYTENMVISFIDLYEKVKRNFPEVRETGYEDRMRIGRAFTEIASKHHMVIRPCGEGRELEVFGADCSGCMTKEIFEKALGTNLTVPSAALKARPLCGCILGSDIGAYNTCRHFCRYCYANADRDIVMENMKKHDPESPLLIGKPDETDVIHQAKQTSWKQNQMMLELF